MKTYLDCIPCFFKQALEAARLAGTNQKTQKRVLHELAKALPEVSLSQPPPLMAHVIYKIVKRVTQKEDPYKRIKQRSNRLALAVYPGLKKEIAGSRDRLLKALEFAIAGNVIDYGANDLLNIEKELKNILRSKNMSRAVFHYAKFKAVLHKSRTIVYLADNAGETVLDRVLLEEIKSLDGNKKIIYTVKEKPIINDALSSDALFAGIDKVAQVISSGLDIPGTVLSLCSRDFLKLYKKADMVISKGQGNFEAFYDMHKPVFSLFMAKCPVVAGDVNCNIGDLNLIYNSGGNKGMAKSSRLF